MDRPSLLCPSIKQHAELGHSRRTMRRSEEGFILAEAAAFGDHVPHATGGEVEPSFSSMLSFQQRNRPNWQLLEKPLGVMPARLFLLTLGG
jgi:hypothetical protein